MSLPEVEKAGASPEGSYRRALDAAAVCFEEQGVENTTMEDIARRAGLGRKTVYRLFPNRSALIESVAIERINVWRDRIKAVVDTCATFEEAAVTGIVEALRCFRQDSIVMAAIEATHAHGVERYLIDPASPVLEKMRYAWQGVFTRARKSGQLRQDLSDDEVSSWLLSIHLILLLRPDIDPSGQRALVTKLVMPGLRPQPASAKSGAPLGSASVHGDDPSRQKRKRKQPIAE